MSPKDKTLPEEPEIGSKIVYCARCDTKNKARESTCSQCGAHLYISCHECGHRNERAASRCDQCGRSLHRSFFRRLRKKFRRGGRHFSMGQIILLIVGVGLGFLFIVLLNGVRFPF